MTVDNPQAVARPAVANIMDDSWLLEDSDYPSSSNGDHAIPSDWGIYASSPNSLHMYDQEKADMQCSFGAQVCGVHNSMLLNEDFDLKTQYETSQDICLPVCPTSGVGNTVTSSSTVTSEMSDWSAKKQEGLLKGNEIFQMDKAGLGSDPTLAELNLDESLLDEIQSIINTDAAKSGTIMEVDAGIQGQQDVLPSEKRGTLEKVNSMETKSEQSLENSPKTVSQVVKVLGKKVCPSVKTEVSTSVSCRGRHQSLPQLTTTPVKYGRSSSNTISSIPATLSQSTLHRLLLQNRGSVSATQTSSPTVQQTPDSPNRKRPSSTAGLDARAVEQKWEEIKQFIDEDQHKPAVKRERLDSDRSSVLTSNDEDSDDGDESGMSDWEDTLSLGDSENSQDGWPLDPESHDSVGKRKRKQYFWQYNLQSKGPKGTKVKFNINDPDPHNVHGFEDPVFDPTTSSVAGVAVGIRHGGKARKGDGNDIAPNPRKLYQIGMQIKKLTRQINDFAPVMDLPVSARNRSRKEKNKLASRACRLKKKAQHEANKVKLYGLDQEHHELMEVIDAILPIMNERISLLEKNGQQPADDEETVTKKMEEKITENMSTMVAGNTTEFVNSIIQKVEDGDPKGGIKPTG